jgi:flagellar biosynthesis/type III secretory pathway protein FliH
MPEGFVPLDEFFRRATVVRSADENASGLAAAAASTLVVEEADGQEYAPELIEALAAARRFRAALADAVDAAVDDLLRGIACDVLARELMLKPADVASIAAGALKRYAADSPVRVRAHPDETSALAGLDLPIVADSDLRRGDVAIDVRTGTIDASLGARLECVLESAS